VINRTNGDYDEAAHKVNPFCADSRTEQARFANNSAEIVWKIYHREARPVSLEALFKNRTLLRKLSDVNEPPEKQSPVLKILVKARELEQEYQTAEREKAIEQQRQDALEAARQGRALSEQMRGIVRRANGQIITMPGGGR
jgi:hypothetical protein